MKFSVTSLSLLLIAMPVWAQTFHGSQKGSVTKDVFIDEVVVTASRFQEEIKTVPANVTVITSEDIEKSTARNIPDLLRSQVGVQVTDTTGNNRSFSVDLRGFGATATTNTLVLVDGRRVNQPDLSGTDWSLISLDRVERIEIIRGGRGSVLYGDNASGGVINIITKQGEEFKVRADIMAGSYDAFDTSASVSGTSGKVSYALSGRYADSDGYRDNSSTEFKDIGGNLTWFVSDRLNLNFSSDYHKDNAGLPGSIKKSDFDAGVSRKDSLNPKDFADIEDYYFKGGPELFFLNNSLFKADISYRKRSSDFNATFTGGSFTGNTEIKTLAVSPQMVFKEKIFNLDNSLTIGFDYEKAEEDIINTLLFFGFQFPPEKFDLEKKNTGYYIYDEFKPVENLALSAGYRYDRAKFRFDPSTPDKVTTDEKLFNAGVNYNFYKNSYAYFGYARSFRYPVLDEFFNFFNNTVNTDLVPQTSNNYELGLRYYFSERFFAHANFFWMETDDEIFLNPLTFANENLDGKTRRQGVEFTLSKSFDNVNLQGTYTYTDAEIRSGQYSGKEIPGVAGHKGNVSVEYVLPMNVTLALNGIYVGERPFDGDFRNEFSDQDDYLVLNAKVRYQWKNYMPFISLNNITNEKYSEYGVLGGFPAEEAFYPSPKFNFMVGVSAEF